MIFCIIYAKPFSLSETNKHTRNPHTNTHSSLPVTDADTNGDPLLIHVQLQIQLQMQMQMEMSTPAPSENLHSHDNKLSLIFFAGEADEQQQQPRPGTLPSLGYSVRVLG